MFKFLIISAQLLSFVFSANILAIVPTPSYSHQIAFTHIWRELSLRGHQVTLITTDPINDPNLVNLTEIDVKFCYEFVASVSSAFTTSMTMWNVHEMILDLTLKSSEAQLSHPSVQELLQKSTNNRTFDVVLVEFVNPEMLAFGLLYDCPTVILSSLDSYSHMHSFFGNPTHPVLWPELGTPFFGALTFKERVVTTIYSLYLSYFFSFKSHRERRRILETYFNTTKTVEELISDADMMFLSTIPALQEIRAHGPTTAIIGGFRPTISSADLPEEIQEFLDSANEGFIYFSLGSNVKSENLPKESLTAVIETLKEVPYKVLWKFEADDLPMRSDKIKLIKWAPQQKVLSHPNIKLFVTQGGFQSMEEGIYAEVPFVVIPFLGDQYYNSKIMSSKGFARIVDKEPFINKNSLKSAILEVINNPIYKNAVVKIKKQIMDTPMSGLENAVWWTEYLIRNKGAKHLRNPAAELPFYQYCLLDVIAFLLSATLLVSWSTVVVIKIAFSFISGRLIRRQSLIQSKKNQ